MGKSTASDIEMQCQVRDNHIEILRRQLQCLQYVENSKNPDEASGEGAGWSSWGMEFTWHEALLFGKCWAGIKEGETFQACQTEGD